MDTAISVIIAPNVEGIDNKCLETLMMRYSVYVLNSFQDSDKLTVQDKDQLLIVDLDSFFEDEDDVSAQFDYKKIIEPILTQFPNINIIGYINIEKAKISSAVAPFLNASYIMNCLSEVALTKLDNNSSLVISLKFFA